jgi:cytochrome c oxidase subunit 2
MVAIGIVVAILVTLVAVLIPWLPDSASVQMDRIEFVFWFATVISIGIFALVAAVVLYSVWAFRARPEDDTDGPPIHGNTNLEIAWTVVPFVLVVAIGVVSAVVLAENGETGDDPLPVTVYAQQFAWRFEYPEGDVRSNELVLPVDRTVDLTMTAADVIHSFWIPEMGQKQDLVPGIETTIAVTPTRTGQFTLVCTELCGLGHSTMRGPVRVVGAAEFDDWLADQAAAAGQDVEGEAVFASAGCGGCHVFAPAGSNSEIGPSLDDLPAAAERAGQPLAEFVRESIVEPDKLVAPGYSPGVMPKTYAQSLTEAELDALVEYLSAQEAGG